MSLADCITEALRVWDEAGIGDAPELAPYREMLEDLQRNKKISPAQAKQKAIQYARKAHKAQFRKTVGRKVSEQKRAERLTALLDLADSDPRGAWDVLRDLFDFGIVKNVARGDATIGLFRRKQAYQSEMLGKLRPILDKYYNRNVFTGLRSTPKGKLLRLAMEGGNVDDPEIMADAKAIRKILSPYVAIGRKNGIDMHELDAWSPGSPMQGKVANRVEEFKAFLRETLDKNRHPDIEETIDVVTKHILDPTEPEKHVLSFSRELHFANPEDRVEFMGKFGDGDIVHSLTNYVRMLSSGIAEAELFGPDSSATVNFLVNQVSRRIRERDPTFKISPRNVIDLYEASAGRNDFIQNPDAAAIVSSSKNFASAAMLGAVPLAQVAQDSLLAPIRNARSMGWGRAFASTAKAYGDMFDPYTRQLLQEDFGIMEHVSHLMTSDARIMLEAPSTNVEQFSRRAAMFTMRFSGTEWLEQMQRGQQALVMGREIARNLDSAWSDLDANTQQLLSNNGIGKGRWQQLARLGNSIVDEHTGSIRMNSIEDTELRMAMRAFVLREVENTILRPDATTRAFMQSGRRGTVSREVTSLALTFLSWPTQFVRSATLRQWNMGVPGALAAYTGLFAGGVITEQLYAVARGQPGYMWDNESLYWRSLVRSGLLSPPGELIIGSIAGDWRATPSLGPVIDSVSTIFGQAGKVGQAAFTDEPYEAASNAIRIGKTLVPNIWWVEGALIKPAFDALMWEVDPDYIIRRDRNWERERQE
jgi:hypothetical protein